MEKGLELLKGLRVFSSKMGEAMEVCVCGGGIMPEKIRQCDFLEMNWSDNGWSNSSDSWMDNGWNNSSDRWTDGGWSNSGGRWIDKGWSNQSEWSDNGWNNDGSGCYITTACVEYMGLPDNCDELETLRHYRDILVEKDEDFRGAVLEYYRKAPVIVQKIMESGQKEEVLSYLYESLVRKSVDLLKSGQIEEAKEHYLTVYRQLEMQYCN